MCPILGTFPASIGYWSIAPIVMQIITLRQNPLSLIMKRISSDQRRHMNILVEASLSVAREANISMTMESGSETRKNLV